MEFCTRKYRILRKEFLSKILLFSENSFKGISFLKLAPLHFFEQKIEFFSNFDQRDFFCKIYPPSLFWAKISKSHLRQVKFPFFWPLTGISLESNREFLFFVVFIFLWIYLLKPFFSFVKFELNLAFKLKGDIILNLQWSSLVEIDGGFKLLVRVDFFRDFLYKMKFWFLLDN